MIKVDVDKIFGTLKEFEQERFIHAQHHQKEGWPLLVHPLDHPDIVSAEQAKTWLREDDYVLGVVVNGKARAYPLNIANYYHQINDVVDGVPVLVND